MNVIFKQALNRCNSRSSIKFLCNVKKFSSSIQKNISNKRTPKDIKDGGDNNEPVNFFGSEAATWKARKSRSGGSEEGLWYQPYVISGSIAVFLIYFCILREESDIDKKLDGKLFDHIEGLEEVQLILNYKYNKENGIDNREIEKRLVDLGVDVNKL